MYQAVRTIVGTKWTLEILAYLADHGPANFSAIEAEFDTSPDVITEKLQVLTERGLIDREERTARDVRYSLTERGAEFLSVLDDLETKLS